MPFMPFMPCHRQTPLSAYKFALNCHAMPVGRFWEVQKVQIQTQFLFWNHALGKERFSKAVQRLLFMILSIVFLALFERPLWTFPKSRHRLMGLCVSGSDLKRVTRLRHPVAPGTWESHQVWSSVEEADSSSAPVALGLADSRILSHKWHKCLKSSLKMIMISEDIWRYLKMWNVSYILFLWCISTMNTCSTCSTCSLGPWRLALKRFLMQVVPSQYPLARQMVIGKPQVGELGHALHMVCINQGVSMIHWDSLYTDYIWYISDYTVYHCLKWSQVRILESVTVCWAAGWLVSPRFLGTRRSVNLGLYSFRPSHLWDWILTYIDYAGCGCERPKAT